MLTLVICRVQNDTLQHAFVCYVFLSISGNIKSEGGASSAGCQETLCSPKWDTGTLIMETRLCAGKPRGTSLVILITAACHLC